jgi:iron complex outermembrane receptor protein
MKIPLPLMSSFKKINQRKQQKSKYNLALLILIFSVLNVGFIQAQTATTGQILGTVITNDGNASQGVVVKLIEINAP